jgi:ubiquinone/menaquinone biosynthesis C-methylase UbiE
MRMSIHHLHGNAPRAFRGRSSRFYNLVARTVLRRVYRRLAQDIADAAPRDAAVLDVGTGPGVLLAELARLRPDLRLTGIDLSPDMVAAARENVADRAIVQVADVTDLPFADASFDLIVSSLSLHHWDDPEAAVPQLARVLREGGSVRIYDFRFAPFEKLNAGAFGARRPQRATIRSGVPLFPRFVRFVLSP